MNFERVGLWWSIGSATLGLLVYLALALPPQPLFIGLAWGQQYLRSWTLGQLWLQGCRWVMLAVLLLGSAWVLCGCGTARLPAPTCPLVPAELLIPPAPPVLLTLGSTWQQPGLTRL